MLEYRLTEHGAMQVLLACAKNAGQDPQNPQVQAFLGAVLNQAYQGFGAVLIVDETSPWFQQIKAKMPGVARNAVKLQPGSQGAPGVWPVSAGGNGQHVPQVQQPQAPPPLFAPPPQGAPMPVQQAPRIPVTAVIPGQPLPELPRPPAAPPGHVVNPGIRVNPPGQVPLEPDAPGSFTSVPPSF